MKKAFQKGKVGLSYFFDFQLFANKEWGLIQGIDHK